MFTRLLLLSILGIVKERDRVISLWDFAIGLVSAYKQRLSKDFDDDVISLSMYKEQLYLCDDFLRFVFVSIFSKELDN